MSPHDPQQRVIGSKVRRAFTGGHTHANERGHEKLQSPYPPSCLGPHLHLTPRTASCPTARTTIPHLPSSPAASPRALPARAPRPPRPSRPSPGKRHPARAEATPDTRPSPPRARPAAASRSRSPRVPPEASHREDPSTSFARTLAERSSRAAISRETRPPSLEPSPPSRLRRRRRRRRRTHPGRPETPTVRRAGRINRGGSSSRAFRRPRARRVPCRRPRAPGDGRSSRARPPRARRTCLLESGRRRRRARGRRRRRRIDPREGCSPARRLFDATIGGAEVPRCRRRREAARTIRPPQVSRARKSRRRGARETSKSPRFEPRRRRSRGRER